MPQYKYSLLHHNLSTMFICLFLSSTEDLLPWFNVCTATIIHFGCRLTGLQQVFTRLLLHAWAVAHVRWFAPRHHSTLPAPDCHTALPSVCELSCGYRISVSLTTGGRFLEEHPPVHERLCTQETWRLAKFPLLLNSGPNYSARLHINHFVGR